MPGLVSIALVAIVAAVLACLIPGYQNLPVQLSSLYAVVAVGTVCIGCRVTNWRYIRALPVGL